MRLRVNQVPAALDYRDADLVACTARKLGVAARSLRGLRVVRRSLDARNPAAAPRYSLTVEVDFAGAAPARWRGDRDLEAVCETPSADHFQAPPWHGAGRRRPVVVGAGPAGLMSALVLARAGAAPIIVERGDAVERRAGKVDAFWREGVLDNESNVLFGEGGAGLFSDGKLTSRSKDRPRIRAFFEALVAAGAPEEILIDASPHVGSDRLLAVVPKFRRLIEEAGGEFQFGTRLDGIHVEGGQLTGLVLNGVEVACRECILAVGHSARDLVGPLLAGGVEMVPKAFAVGVRVEVPQEQIDRSQWGRWAGREGLGAASYKLTRREDEGVRACYSFCMCPGGTVISCASAPGMLTTNGMSLQRRAKPFGNAAFLVPVEPADFAGAGDEGPPELAGYRYQAALERLAWAAGGGDFSLPACSLQEFVAGIRPASLSAFRSCPRAVPADVAALLPEFVVSTLRRCIPPMLGQLREVRQEEATVYGVESRSSSPVRLVRGETMMNPGVAGLYPCGEGAGYAGGIVSSAVDGLKAAEALLAEPF